MTLIEIALLFVAGFLSGAINAVAGGGTFISFGTLSVLGVPPISANAASSIAQLPGYVTGVRQVQLRTSASIVPVTFSAKA